MQKRIYISISLLILTIGLYGQTANPFDLKWRSKKSEPTVLESESRDTHELAKMSTAAATDSSSFVMDTTSLVDAGKSSTISDASDDSILALSASEDDINIENSSSELERVDPIPEEESTSSTKDDGEMLEATSGDPESTIAQEKASEILDTKVTTSEDIEALPAQDIRTPVKKRQTTPTGNIVMSLFLILFGLALVVLTWAVNINRGFLQKIYKAALNENFSALLLREQRFASSQYLYYIVYAVFFFNGGLFIYLISRYATWDFGHRTTPMILFLIFLGAVYALKHIVTRVLGETFQISNEMRHYNFYVILYNILVGIALMPVNLFLAFGPSGMRMPMIYTGLGIIAIMYLMRQIRGMMMSSHLIIKDAFQFFVYLCAIEILPVLVLFKFFPN